MLPDFTQVLCGPSQIPKRTTLKFNQFYLSATLGLPKFALNFSSHNYENVPNFMFF
jgi:hypothetical protein